MSTPQQGEGGGGGGGNFFTRKMGPLPMWAWLALVAILFIAYSYKKKSSANQQAQAANTPGGVDASLVPQFINQEYVNTQPPQAPSVTVNNTVPDTDEKPPTIIPGQPSTRPPFRTVQPFEPIFNGTYTVRPGQTLQQVSTMFHISREQLAHANGLGTGAGLRAGQTLKVPVPAPAGTPNKAQLWLICP